MEKDLKKKHQKYFKNNYSVFNGKTCNVEEIELEYRKELDKGHNISIEDLIKLRVEH
jgi:hypothetical protein